MSRVPWQTPIQKGTETFPATTRIPVKTVVTVPPGADPDAAREVYERHQAVISKFYLKAAQAHSQGIVDVSATHMEVPGLRLRYTNQQGVEVVVVEVTATMTKSRRGGSAETPWDWVIVEVVVDGLSPEGADDKATGAHSVATCENTASQTPFVYPVATNTSNPQDNYDSLPVLKFAETPFAEKIAIDSPEPTTVILSMVVDLRRFGREDVVVDLAAGLDGGTHPVVTSYSRPTGSFTLVSQVVTTLGNLDWTHTFANGDGIITVNTSAEDLWPIVNGPHYYTISTNELSALSGSYGALYTGNPNATLPADAFWVDKRFSFPAGHAPLATPLDAGWAYQPGSSTPNGTPEDLFVRRFKAAVLSTWPTSGLIRQYQINMPSTGTLVRTLSGGIYHSVLEAKMTTSVLEFPDATAVTSRVPSDVELPARIRWGAGFGEPPGKAVVASAQHVFYHEWVMSLAPVTYANVGYLDDIIQLSNSEDTELGQLKINRHLHAFALKTA